MSDTADDEIERLRRFMAARLKPGWFATVTVMVQDGRIVVVREDRSWKIGKLPATTE